MVGKFECRDGYMLKGHNTTQCFFGNWTGMTPWCKEGTRPFSRFPTGILMSKFYSSQCINFRRINPPGRLTFRPIIIRYSYMNLIRFYHVMTTRKISTLHVPTSQFSAPSPGSSTTARCSSWARWASTSTGPTSARSATTGRSCTSAIAASSCSAVPPARPASTDSGVRRNYPGM